MTRIYALLLRLYPADHRQAWADGMAATFDMRVRDRSGARRLRFVIKEFASVTGTALGEWTRRIPRRQMINNLWMDVRVLLRGWRREPGTATVIIMTLALGIGATTAIFSVVDGVLLRPLPFPAADRLVRLEELRPDGSAFTLSMPDFFDYRQQAATLDGVAVYDSVSVALTGEGDAERVPAMQVSPGFFAMLELEMTLGRGFGPEDEIEGAPRTVIVGHARWLDRYGADPAVLGRTLRLDGREHTVVGVAPAGVAFGGDEPELWIPFTITGAGMDNRGGHMYPVLARIAEGTTLEVARQEVGSIARNIVETTPDDHDEGVGAMLTPLKETIVSDVDDTLLLLLGAVGMLLLIACGNVASIMLARADARAGEVAMRVALGASSGRVVRFVVTESLLFAGAGSIVGLAFARFGTRAVIDRLAADLPRAGDVGIDLRLLGFAVMATLATGLLMGLLPAARAFRPDVYAAIRGGVNAQTTGARSSAVHRVLVVAEIALAVMLALGAALLVQSLVRLQGVERGFEAEGALTFRIALPAARYETMESTRTFIATLEEELAALPGIESAGAVGLLPFFSSQTTGIALAGTDPDLALGGVQFRYATPGYFDAIGTRLLRGRVFSERDTPDAPPVIIVGEELARRLVPDGDAIGERVYIPGWGGPEAIEIVGIVEDVRLTGLRQQPPAVMYWPYGQWNSRSTMSFVVQADSDPGPLTDAIRRLVRRLDPDLPVYSIELLSNRTNRSLAQERLGAWLLTGFAGAAVLLGAVGVFGVMSHRVVRRVPELGLRVALGASPARVTRMVFAEGIALAGTGVALGIGGALALGRTFAALLYETSPSDPLTHATISATLLIVALLACLLPAWRGANVDPMLVLRS